jgi:hypothetical protein
MVNNLLPCLFQWHSALVAWKALAKGQSPGPKLLNLLGISRRSLRWWLSILGSGKRFPQPERAASGLVDGWSFCSPAKSRVLPCH